MAPPAPPPTRRLEPTRLWLAAAVSRVTSLLANGAGRPRVTRPALSKRRRASNRRRWVLASASILAGILGIFNRHGTSIYELEIADDVVVVVVEFKRRSQGRIKGDDRVRTATPSPPFSPY